MANKKINLDNNNLTFDLEKIRGYSEPNIYKNAFANDVHKKIFTIEVNDNSYFYTERTVRDDDYRELKVILKTK